MNADVFRKLVAAGLDTDQIAAVLEIMEERESEIAAQDEARKAKVRDRVAKWREGQKADVTLPKHNGNGVKRLTRAEKTNNNTHSSNHKDSSSFQSEERAPAKRAHRMPDDFEPDLNFAISKGLTHSEAKAEVERMRDWSKSSKNGAKLDWQATWRGWISRKAEERRPTSRAPPPKSHFQSHQDDVRRELDSVINGNRSRDDEFTGHTIEH